jgi:PKHD-type hydroxylase
MKEVTWNWVSNIPSSTINKWIKDIESKYTLGAASVGLEYGESIKEAYRSTKVCFVDKNDFPEVWGSCEEFLLDANKRAYNFDITGIEECQYAVYSSKTMDFYKWHIDSNISSSTSLFDRKITMIIQLSDGEEYEGGNLVLDSNFVPPFSSEYKNNLRSKGTVITFPSFVPHKVTPVTKGTRKSMVLWAEGPAFR